jgi:hypothetical protein
LLVSFHYWKFELITRVQEIRTQNLDVCRLLNFQKLLHLQVKELFGLFGNVPCDSGPGLEGSLHEGSSKHRGKPSSNTGSGMISGSPSIHGERKGVSDNEKSTI